MFAALAVDQSPGRDFTGRSHAETLHDLPGRHIVALCKRNDRVRSKRVKGETKPRAADLRREPAAAKRLKHGPAQLQPLLHPGRPGENGNLGARGPRCHTGQTAPARQRSGSPVIGDPFGHAVHSPAASAVPRERLSPRGRPLSGIPRSDPGILPIGASRSLSVRTSPLTRKCLRPLRQHTPIRPSSRPETSASPSEHADRERRVGPPWPQIPGCESLLSHQSGRGGVPVEVG